MFGSIDRQEYLVKYLVEISPIDSVEIYHCDFVVFQGN